MRCLKTFTHRAESVVTEVSRFLNVIGMIGTVMLMLLITSDILGRFFFNHPIPGTIHISEYVLVIAVYCSVAYCAMLKGHVNLDLLVSKLRGRARAIIDCVTGFVALTVFSVIAWRSAVMVVYSWTRGETSTDQLGISVWPFRTILVIGIVMLCLVLLTEIVHLVAKMVKK